MEIKDINPYIRIATASVLPSSYTIKQRIIFDYEIIYVESGSLTLCYADRTYECRPGEIIFIRPGVPHSISAGDEPISQPHIHFDLTHSGDSKDVRICFKDKEDLDSQELRYIRSDAFSFLGASPFPTVKDKSGFLSLFYRIINDEAVLAKKGLLTELLSMLIEDNCPWMLVEEERYTVERQIRDWIDAGQCLDMSLDLISDRFSYNKYYLEKRFRAAYGVGIIAYRNEKRLELAKELLLTESVMSVASQLGFGSIYAFSRAFKLRYGVSPSKIKK